MKRQADSVVGGFDEREPTAFVDESIRPGDAGLYVVAVVTIGDLERARSAAIKVPPKSRRFHWKDEERPQRLDMLGLLVEQGCGLRTYETQPCPTSKQERARAKCIERMLWDLQQLDIDQLVIESRGPAADRKDRQSVLHAIQAGVASPTLLYEHRRGPHDPALWLPDAVAGAAAAALTGQGGYRAHLGPSLTRTRITL